MHIKSWFYNHYQKDTHLETNRYKLLEYYLDDDSRKETEQNSSVVIHIGQYTCTICIMNTISNMPKFLGHYFVNPKTYLDKIHIIDDILASKPFIKNNIPEKATLCVDNNKFTLIPKDMFESEICKKYLDFSCSTEGYAARYRILERLGIVVVFGLEVELLQWLNNIKFFTKKTIIHQANSIILGSTNLIATDDESHTPSVFIFFIEEMFHISVLSKKSFIYYNRFIFKNHTAFISEILTIFEVLNINRYTNQVTLLGYINDKSELYKIVKKYITHVNMMHKYSIFGTKQLLFRNMYARYMNVLNAHLC